MFLKLLLNRTWPDISFDKGLIRVDEYAGGSPELEDSSRYKVERETGGRRFIEAIIEGYKFIKPPNYFILLWVLILHLSIETPVIINNTSQNCLIPAILAYETTPSASQQLRMSKLT